MLYDNVLHNYCGIFNLELLIDTLILLKHSKFT